MTGYLRPRQNIKFSARSALACGLIICSLRGDSAIFQAIDDRFLPNHFTHFSPPLPWNHASYDKCVAAPNAVIVVKFHAYHHFKVSHSSRIFINLCHCYCQCVHFLEIEQVNCSAPSPLPWISVGFPYLRCVAINCTFACVRDVRASRSRYKEIISCNAYFSAFRMPSNI